MNNQAKLMEEYQKLSAAKERTSKLRSEIEQKYMTKKYDETLGREVDWVNLNQIKNSAEFYDYANLYVDSLNYEICTDIMKDKLVELGALPKEKEIKYADPIEIFYGLKDFFEIEGDPVLYAFWPEVELTHMENNKVVEGKVTPFVLGEEIPNYTCDKINKMSLRDQAALLKSELDKKFAVNNLSWQADAMVEAMAQGRIDTNGQPITNTQPVNSRQMGFAKVGLLAIGTVAVSIGIVILGNLLR